MKLLVPIFLNILAVTGFYLLEKYTPYKKLSYIQKQLIIGVLFGALSVFASEFGVALLGTVVNVRDAAPLSAGLIFGAPSGIISGVIGGLYRWFSTAWGAGEYTRLACTIATIFSGVFAAVLRKFMFDDKKPTWGYGIAITVVCEVLHMLLIFLTNMNDSAYAFEFVRGASLPMIAGNAFAVGAAIVSVSLLSREKLISTKDSEHIAQTFQRWLLLCIVVAYLVTSVFNFNLQNGMAKIETQRVFTSAINDVRKDIRDKSDDNIIKKANEIRTQYIADPSKSLTVLAEENGVTEINIVDSSGLIINSTEERYIGVFNMNDTEQSRAFMVLTGEATEYVQEYSVIGSDGTTMRKYAGLSLEDGGYIQVGYDAEQFHDKLDDFAVDVTKNRHVGSNGFIAVCDENLNMVTQTNRNGDHISSIGIEPNEEVLSGKDASQLYTTNIINTQNGYSEKYIYVFSFVEGYCVIAAMPQAEAMMMRDASLYTSIFMQILIFAALFAFIYFLIKRVIINNLQKINRTLSQITDGNLNVTVDVRSNAEFASLSDDINSTVSTLKTYISEAAARIDRELEYAKQIQLSALPTNYPDNDSYRIFARMIAAKEVGGDFYDFYRINDDTVAFLAADVSGKGIPAAMFMMTAKTIIKDLAEQRLAVNDIFTTANEKLCENNDSGMFVTAWMGILNLTTGKLQYANAGHNPPLILHGNGDFEYLKSRAGFVLAGMEGISYKMNEMELHSGDRIFLYTDGVTEATDTAQRLYGEERLAEYLNAHKNMDASELLIGLKSNIDQFVGEAPQFDDITMLMFDYKHKKGGDSMTEKSFPAEKSALDDVIEYVAHTLESVDCPSKTATAICVAIEEAFINVARYAYADIQGEVRLSIAFDQSSRTATFELSDEGVPFDPLSKPDPDITLSADEREIGGLGIFIVKKTMDSVSYRFENNRNILTMTKII